jgi:hypothetical protein
VRLALVRLALVPLVLAVVVVVTGCGGSRRGPAQRSPKLSLPQRLIRAARFPGFHRFATPAVTRDPERWEAKAGLVGSELRHATDRLTRLGFVAGGRETLAPHYRSQVEIVSTVEEFRSSEGAKAELAGAHAQPRARGVRPEVTEHEFPVPAVPGARGIETKAPFSKRQSVAFAAGRFFYLVTVTAPSGGGKPPTRQHLIASSTAWYHRVSKDSAV